ncbi:mandelate racemase/muconate lactonizing enzyme family protein [Leucobacter sp. GX24907]
MREKMKIQSIEAIPLAASFSSLFKFGTINRTTSPNVVIILRSDEGHVGYGEAVAVPAFTSETPTSIVELVETRIAPVIVGRDPLDRGPLLADISKSLRFAPFTIAALDIALFDLSGKALGVPMSQLLGGTYRTSTPVHGSVGWDEDAQKMVDLAVEQARTFDSLKLYAGRGEIDEDLDRLQAVREAVGPDVELFVDVNTMWEPSQFARALDRSSEIGLRGFEQPMPLAAAPLQKQLMAGRSVDIIADEAVRTVTDAARVAAEGTATVMNVGLQKLGGPTAALQAAQLATANGIGVHVGAVLEMGIGTAAGLHFAAAMPRLSYPSYLMGPLKYAQCITAEQIEIVDSAIAIPQGPGLGIEVDEQAVRDLDLRKQ